eukprot:c12352_g1_i2.p2 GENE.c12352_g1_i2~~c12352_g1_i2.p2  ORF type:complete len:204 (+),score=44.31 c12352_g1_i2:73-612(+)
MARIPFETNGFSLVIVQHPATKMFLAIKEARNRGWWLPGGHVDEGQTFLDAAIAEVKEEAGIDVKLTGILAIEHTLTSPRQARQRIIFFGIPTDPNQPPKSVPDVESDGAAWMTLDELRGLAKHPPPNGLRGHEILNWAEHVERGGFIVPLSFLQTENTGPSEARKAVPNKLDKEYFLL